MLKIEFDEKNNRVIAYDENKIIGICEYLVNNNEWNIIHTEVNKDYQGQGIARKLVNKVIEEANKKQKNITAECSYAYKLINN